MPLPPENNLHLLRKAYTYQPISSQLSSATTLSSSAVTGISLSFRLRYPVLRLADIDAQYANDDLW